MTENANPLMNFLCEAMALEKKEADFFRKEAKDCPHAMGREIFSMLAQEEAEQEKGLKQIHDSLKAEEKWPGTCAIFSKDLKELRASFDAAITRYKTSIKAAGEIPRALEIAIDIEKDALSFYEKYAKKITDPKGGELLKTLVEGERGHLLMLLDLHQFYTDPEGYFLEKEHRGLDGA